MRKRGKLKVIMGSKESDLSWYEKKMMVRKCEYYRKEILKGRVIGIGFAAIRPDQSISTTWYVSRKESCWSLAGAVAALMHRLVTGDD